MTYLVIGATGNVGGELATLLLEQGHRVRALVRDASRAKRLPAGIDTYLLPVVLVIMGISLSPVLLMIMRGAGGRRATAAPDEPADGLPAE